MADLVKIRVRLTDTQRSVIQYPNLGADEPRVGLHLRFCQYDQKWRVWFLDSAGAVIAGPRSLVPGIDLLLGLKHYNLIPKGQLFVYSVNKQPPDATTVDVSAILYYRPEGST